MSTASDRFRGACPRWPRLSEGEGACGAGGLGVKRPANDVIGSGDLAALIDDLAALAVEFHLDGRFEQSVDGDHEEEHAHEQEPKPVDANVSTGGR
jgi:hypothetical protein